MLLQSKGGILSKACEYIKELRQNNMKLAEEVGGLDRLRVDNQLLRQEVSVCAWDRDSRASLPRPLLAEALSNGCPNLDLEGCCPATNACCVY